MAIKHCTKTLVYDDEAFEMKKNELVYNEDYDGPIDLPYGDHNFDGLFEKVWFAPHCRINKAQSSVSKKMFANAILPAQWSFGDELELDAKVCKKLKVFDGTVLEGPTYFDFEGSEEDILDVVRGLRLGLSTGVALCEKKYKEYLPMIAKRLQNRDNQFDVEAFRIEEPHCTWQSSHAAFKGAPASLLLLIDDAQLFLDAVYTPRCTAHDRQCRSYARAFWQYIPKDFFADCHSMDVCWHKYKNFVDNALVSTDFVYDFDVNQILWNLIRENTSNLVSMLKVRASAVADEVYRYQWLDNEDNVKAALAAKDVFELHRLYVKAVYGAE